MPDDDSASATRLAGLALSGGGFRATLFHLGALWRMNEFGLLAKLDRITGGVAGGAITAGHFGSCWHKLSFQDGVAGNVAEVVAKPIKHF